MDKTANGLSGGKLVPDGNNVAFIPGAGGNGSGILYQTLANGFTFAAGNTYTFEAWVAMPLIVAPANASVPARTKKICNRKGP